ncbi:MAG: hypothetical protein MUC93_13640 [Bacteroidales bacterium]|jgi:hypothetical protein|nr:hypothetical protein [Bacteroidales bacterium]
MKFMKNKSIILLFSLFLGFVAGFTACSSDEEIIPKTLEEYQTELSAIITSEIAKVQNCVVGYDKGNFKSELLFADYRYNYMSALVSAEATLAKPDLTIVDIVAANKAIAVPGKAFNDNLYISDRRPIHELIVICDTLIAHTPEGIAVGQAPAAERNTFIAAISRAKTIRSTSTTIERQVLEAVEVLNQALTVFQSAIIK